MSGLVFYNNRVYESNCCSDIENQPADVFEAELNGGIKIQAKGFLLQITSEVNYIVIPRKLNTGAREQISSPVNAVLHHALFAPVEDDSVV